MVSLMDCCCKGTHRTLGVDDTWHPVSINLYAKEGKKERTFLSAQVWRPSTYYERACTYSFVPLTTAAVAVTTQPWLIYRLPPKSITELWKASCIKQGEGRLSTDSSQCSVLYGRGRGGSLLFFTLTRRYSLQCSPWSQKVLKPYNK